MERIVEYDTIRQHDADQHKVVDAHRHVVVPGRDPQRINQSTHRRRSLAGSGVLVALVLGLAIINAAGVAPNWSPSMP
jgi:hypothetical protein